MPVVRAEAATTAPPAGYQAGTGNVQGTESVQDEQFLGIPCFKTTRSVFALRGAGTYAGVTASGQSVVYNAQITSGQTLYGDGPLHLEVENTQTYYHGPQGTAGPTDSTCSTSGIDVTAQFRVWATDHVYQLDGSGAQVPCVGHGTFARGPNSPDWHAQWTLDTDCTVVGNAAGTPGMGLARTGTGFTHSGVHQPCFDTCVNNIQVDYVQYLPFVGPHLGLTGPTSTKVNTQAAMTANDTNDGAPVPGASVTFSVTGPAPTSPSGATSTTGSDGRASFSFTTPTAGTYTVTVTTPASGGGSLTATQTVQFVPPTPATVKLSGPSGAQTEENVRVAAAFTNDDQPTQNVQVNFSVTGPGTVTPATGSATTESHGWALYDFSADRAGTYTVTASATYFSQHTTDTLSIPLQINTFSRQATITFPSNEGATRGAVIDPGGAYAYVGDSAGIVKIDLATFQRVGVLAWPNNFIQSAVAVIDPAGTYAYFGNQTLSPDPGSPWCGACILKVDLASFQVVGMASLQPDERQLRSAVIDPAGHFGYFGFNWDYTAPGKVAKVDLQTMQEVGTITLPPGETSLDTALMSPAGDFAYFGARGSGSSPAHLVKVDLATFQRVGALVMADSSENWVPGSVIDPDGHYAYLALNEAAGLPETSNILVKVDVTALSRAGSMKLESFSPYFNSAEAEMYSAVMDPNGNFAYFGTHESAGREQRVLRIDLRTFQKALPVTVSDAKQGFRAGVITRDGSHAYFVNDQSPVELMKLSLTRPANPALAANPDSYVTNYVTPLHVAAPGVLGNDVNNADSFPLAAGQASAAAHGTVTINADGSFDYTPDAGYTGTDTFTYTANNAKDYSPPATVSIAVGGAPQGVSSVGGGAMGWYTNVGLFGGPQAVKGGSGSACGQGGQPACATDQSPAVSLPPSGGDVSASDPDGSVGAYGPAHIFENDGAINVHAHGATGSGGSATASASVARIEDNDPFRAASPDGVASSTCTASETVLSGSTHVTNGTLVLHTDPTTGDPTQTLTLPHDWDPAPNTEFNGGLDHVGDHWRIVFNEQVFGPESITVNAVHMYLLGSIAVGDMIIGQSRCAVTTTAANAPPTAADNSYAAVAGHTLTVGAPGLLANDTDADAQALRASKVLPTPPPTSGGGTWTFPSDPAHGSLVLNGDGSFTYTAALGYSGTDSFAYLATDSRGKSATATVTITVTLPPRRPVADFDGNGTTDIAVFRPSTGAWFVGSNPPTYLGLSGDVAVPCDYDGDGTVDRAVFRDGAWYVGSNAPVFLGLAGDVPVPGDYGGDGRCDVAVYRPSTGAWYVGSNAPVYFGLSGDIPVPGDYDGNGSTDRAVFRPSTGAWYVGSNAPSYLGLSGDIPVPGDYDGDRTTDLAVFRPSTGAWYVGPNGPTYLGLSGDVPLPLPAAVRLSFFG